MRIAFCEGRRLCLALIFDRVDRFPRAVAGLAEEVGFFAPVFSAVEEPDLAGLAEVLEAASED